ncbi:hypothetical protein FIBSPDRAFT_793624 [Athelia psychrophila]|uniref:Large ribosomal subunit protein bL28c n=1 Tax=Athelia psychrophila TaxID=1759441 RepID=A0A166FN82_9AGAM|nr:hypothetical protein FIBSPDRAFT_793624 [Fibularhizoctonia sp. CBS 109695]
MFWSLPRFTTLPIISQPFKRAQEGLFHGKMRRSGNNVPHSKHKTKRTWLPNVRSKKLPLEATGETLKLKVTVRALRSIRKAGGLDNYVMNTKSTLLGMEGMRLRVLVRARLEEEAAVKDMSERAMRATAKDFKRLGLTSQLAALTAEGAVEASPLETLNVSP